MNCPGVDAEFTKIHVRQIVSLRAYENSAPTGGPNDHAFFRCHQCRRVNAHTMTQSSMPNFEHFGFSQLHLSAKPLLDAGTELFYVPAILRAKQNINPIFQSAEGV